MAYEKTVYWDACIWIAWIWNEKRLKHELDGVLECVNEVRANKTLVITSSVFYNEISEAKLTDDNRRLFESFVKRRNPRIVHPDLRTGQLCIDIRKSHRELTEFDATHLATAINYRVDAFYTFDQGKKGGVNLLALDGNVAGHRLKICKPPVTQYRLFQ